MDRCKCKPAAKAKNIELIIDAKKEAWQSDHRGDKERITRILISIISNAVKFTDEKGKISLSLERKENDKGETIANFFITDTGIGIAKDNLKNIYEQFFKVKASYNSSNLNESGPGVGLAIAHQYALDIGAQLSCDSEEGKGSVFVLSLPLKPSFVTGSEMKSKLNKLD